MEDKKTKSAAPKKAAPKPTATKPTNVYSALALFQSVVPAISKGNTAGTGNFKYKYGSLPDIIETIKPHMAVAGLGFTQPIVMEEGKEIIKTVLFHAESEDFIESMIELPPIEFKGMNVVQSKGSVISYLRRYSLMSILGLVTDDDDNDAQGTTTPPKKGQAAKGGPGAPAKSNVSTPAQNPVEKPWLNPGPVGGVNDVWNKAVKFLADGGTIGEIKMKYKIGKNNEERLLNESLTYDDLPFDRQAAEGTAAGDPPPPEPPATGDGFQSNMEFDNQGS